MNLSHKISPFFLFLILNVPFISNTTGNEVDLVFVVDHSGSTIMTDPEKLVSIACITALNRIISISPFSNVGFMGFSNGVCDGTQKNMDPDMGAGKKFEEKADTRVFPLPLNSPGHKEKLLEPMTFSPDNFITCCGENHPKGYGTNLYKPLLLAEEWLMDQTATPNKKFILLISDGGITLGREDLLEIIGRVDSTNFPAVLAITFAIRSKNPDLENLVNKTGGFYSFIEEADYLEAELPRMIDEFVFPKTSSGTASLIRIERPNPRAGRLTAIARYPVSTLEVFSPQGRLAHKLEAGPIPLNTILDSKDVLRVSITAGWYIIRVRDGNQTFINNFHCFISK